MDEVTYDVSGNPVVRRRIEIVAHESENRPLTAILQIEDDSYDVTLTEEKISWTPLSSKSKGFKRKKSKIRKKSSRIEEDEIETSNGDSLTSILTKDIIGVTIRREKKASQKDREGICIGFAVYTYDTKENGRLKPRLIAFGHPSEETCFEWCSRIQHYLSAYTERPKKLKIFIQPYSGKKHSRYNFNKIKPLLNAASIEQDITEISHNEQIKQNLIHMDLSLYDSIVCVGGDGTVSKVVNGVLHKIHSDEGVEIRPGYSPCKASIPIGIIPTGTFNQLAYSLYGSSDVFNATVHIILGHKRPVDAFSVFQDDQFIQWSFMGHYGFFANVLPFLPRYANLGLRKIEAGFMKALTKSKFRSYECDIRFVPLDEDYSRHGDPAGGKVCRQGCEICQLLSAEDQGQTLDAVQELDPLNSSNGSSIIRDMSDKNPYKTVKGDFLNVSLLSVPGNSDLTPGGMGKFTHLNDGCMDLILVRNTERKEFVRYLKRHGNCKNQLEFPFVEAYRTKDVRISLRFDMTWKHRDLNYSEINYEIQRKEKLHDENFKAQKDEVEVIDVLHDFSDDDSDEEEDEEAIANSAMLSCEGSPKPGQVSWASTNLAYKKSIDEGMEPGKGQAKGGAWNKNSIQEGTDTMMVVSDKYRPTFHEMENARRGRQKKKKENKKKLKDEKKMRSSWNFDNEISNETDLEFKAHCGLVTFHGLGLCDDFEIDEVKMGCLSVF